MRFTVRVPNRIVRYLDRMPPRLRSQCLARFDELAEDPYDSAHSEPLVGRWAGHRKSRVGGYRIVYSVKDSELQVIVVRVGPRGDVYKD